MYRLWYVKLALFACVLALISCGDARREGDSGPQEKLKVVDEKLDKLFTELLQTEVKNKMKDPDAAQFRNVTHYGTYLTFKDGKRIKLSHHRICGEVNGKNSFGAYIGFRPFLAVLFWDDDNKKVEKGFPIAKIFNDEVLLKQEQELLQDTCQDKEMKE